MKAWELQKNNWSMVILGIICEKTDLEEEDTQTSQ